jgi:hypothetical protein
VFIKKKGKTLLLYFFVISFLAGFIGVFFSESYNYFYRFFIISIIIFIHCVIINIFGILRSIKKKEIDFYCFFSIPILLSIVLGIFIFGYKIRKWDIEMYEAAKIINNYYSIHEVISLNSEELIKLGIQEKVYITINEDKTYYIVNKGKNIVYTSKYDTIWEEDNDY